MALAAKNVGSKKKPRVQRKPTTLQLALQAIRPDLFIMQKKPFARAVKDIAEQMNPDIQIEADALKALQSVVETMLVGEFELANVQAQLKGLVTIQQIDMVRASRERLFRVGDSWTRA